MSAESELLTKLRETRSDYEAELHWHRFLLDAYSGAGGFEGEIKQSAVALLGWAAEVYSATTTVSRLPGAITTPRSYLDQFPREDDEKYKQRRKVAHYTNYVAPIADLLCSYVSKEQETREGVEGTPLADWLQAVNAAGTSLDDLMRDTITIRCALLGWMPVLVDAPRIPEGVVNAAQSEGLAITPRAIPLFPANLLDWQCSDEGTFEWAKVRTDHVERPDPMGPALNIERVAYWYPQRVDVYRVIKTDNGERVEGPETIAHSFGRVPIVVFRHKASPEDPVRGLPMLHDVSVAARRLFNLESELDEHIRASVFAILGIPMADTSHEIGEVIGGNGTVLKVPMNANMPLHFVAPPASVAATLETRITNTIREIYRMARVEYSKPTGTVQSGESKAYEFEQTNRRLGDFAAQLARAEERLLRLVAPALSMSDDAAEAVSVTPARSFRVEDLATDLANTLAAIKVELGATALRYMRSRVVDKVLPNLPPQVRKQVMEELEGLARQVPVAGSEKTTTEQPRGVSAAATGEST